MKTVYKCSICGKEYKTKEGAVNCELSGKKEHSYEAGTVVRIKTNPMCSSYTAIILKKDGYEGHFPQYEIDLRNGLCFYQVNESQIVEVIFGSEEYKEKEKRFELYKESLKALTKEYFGDSVKIDDYSMLLWNRDKVAKIKFYIEDKK